MLEVHKNCTRKRNLIIGSSFSVLFLLSLTPALNPTFVVADSDSDSDDNVLSKDDFMRAVVRDEYDTILDALEDGVKPNEMHDDVGGSALHYAATLPSDRLAKALIKFGAQVEAKDQTGATPLHWAALHGVVASIEVLLKAGAKPWRSNSDGITPVHAACSSNNSPALITLITKGMADVNAVDKKGWTPLMHALNMSSIECSNLLINSFGAKTTGKDAQGVTPLHFAVLGGSLKLVRLILSTKPKIDATEKSHDFTPFMFAANLERFDICDALLENGANIAAIDNFGYNALHHAIRRLSVDSCKYLLEKGADITTRGHDTLTPLHLASATEHTEIVKLFLKYDVDINIVDKWGATPIHWAADIGHYDTFRFLYDNGADLNITLAKGNTILDVVLAHIKRGESNPIGYLKIESFLIEKGIESKIPMKNGLRVLHMVASEHVPLSDTFYEEDEVEEKEMEPKPTPKAETVEIDYKTNKEEL